jgi:membrane protein YdbS with pleckstrin-like domain
VTGAGLLAGAYFPHTLNMPVEVKTPRQYELLIRMTRIAAIIMLLMTLAIPATILFFATPSPWPILASVGLLLFDIIVFCILIHRAA